jgi:hypothetical protein
MCSIWIEHIEPRLLRVQGLTMRKQLVGEHALEHELGNALLWRWAQMDKEESVQSPYISYKHVMQLDFSVCTSSTTHCSLARF